MSDELFDVIFFGILQSGREKEAVMYNMASLFKTDPEKLAPYFTGGRKVIKSKITATAAEKYKAALENVGLVITIEASVIADKSNNEESIDTGNMSLAPVGANVIETPVSTSVQVIDDISAISMAEVGVDVIENPVEKPVQQIEDYSEISMADVGANVLEHPVPVVPQPIEELAGITLAETGADIIENPEPEKTADIPDTSELSLDK